MVEDHLESGGIYEDLIKIALKNKVSRLHNINIPKNFIRTYGSYNDIIKTIGMDKLSIEKIIKKLV